MASRWPLYLLEVEGAQLGLLPKLPLALGVGVVQLAGQLLGVAVLLDGPRLVGQAQGLGRAAGEESTREGNENDEGGQE